MPKALHKTLVFSLTIAFLALVGWELILQHNPIKTTVWNYHFNSAVAAFYFIAAALAFWRMRDYDSNCPEKRALKYFGLAGLLWGLAFMVWVYYNVVLHSTVPFPSLADVFFIPAYPLFGFAIWNMREAYHTKLNARGVRDAIIYVVVSAIIILTFLNRPDLSPDLGMFKNLLNVTYSIGDVLLVAAAFIEIRSGQAKKHRSLYLLAMFLLLQASGDFMFAYHNNAEKYWNGESADLFFGASGYVFALMLAQNKLFKRAK